MKPLFSVGESVVLQTNIYKEDDVHSTVKSVKLLGDGYVYEVYGINSIWGEDCLRKKHKPSEDSFESMMSKLKSSLRRLLR